MIPTPSGFPLSALGADDPPSPAVGAGVTLGSLVLVGALAWLAYTWLDDEGKADRRAAARAQRAIAPPRLTPEEEDDLAYYREMSQLPGDPVVEVWRFQRGADIERRLRSQRLAPAQPLGEVDDGLLKDRVAERVAVTAATDVPDDHIARLARGDAEGQGRDQAAPVPAHVAARHHAQPPVEPSGDLHGRLGDGVELLVRRGRLEVVVEGAAQHLDPAHQLLGRLILLGAKDDRVDLD